MPRTVIGPETRVSGPLTGQDDLLVEGTVEGSVTGTAQVTVAAGARVGGEVRGREVIIGGVMRHAIHGSAGVRLLATAEVYADISAPKIAIDEGAVFEGQVRMGRRAPAAESVPAAALPAAPSAREIPLLPAIGKKKLVRRT